MERDWYAQKPDKATLTGRQEDLEPQRALTSKHVASLALMTDTGGMPQDLCLP